MQKIDKKKIKKILILGSIGIGNLLLFSPALKIIRKQFPESKIIMVVLKKSFALLYEEETDVDEIYILDVDETKSIKNKMKALRDLKKFAPDLTVTTFPGNRFEYNLIPFLTGAKYRVAHKYSQKKFSNFSFLQNRRIRVDNSLHDLEQNLNLVIPLGLDINSIEKKIFMHIADEDYEFAEAYLKKQNISENKVIGIHPGSSKERGMDYKRWPAEYFAELCDRLYVDSGYVTLIFGGNDEDLLKRKVYESMTNKPVLVEQLSLKKTAALISKCNKFITNDSGLMHMAVAVGVPAFALFGPSDPGRTAPFGDKHKVIRLGIHCSPCWSIKNLGVGWVKCIYKNNLCMKNLTVDYVYNSILG